MTRKRWLLISLGALIFLYAVMGLFQNTGQKPSTKKQPKKQPYVSALQVGSVYRQDDDYLKLIDRSHYILLRHWEWSVNPDDESKPYHPMYIYGVGTYTSSSNQVRLGPTIHWMQVFFQSKRDRDQKKAKDIQEYMAYQVTIGKSPIAGLPEMQLRLHKGRWRIIEDPLKYLHPSGVKLPNSIEAAKSQYTTKKYERYE